MRLASITWYNPSGKGFWHHVLPESNNCYMVHKRLLVVAPGSDAYWLDEHGYTELSKFAPAELHQDND
jgi:hypothetical protein